MSDWLVESWKGLTAIVGSTMVLLGVITTALFRRRSERENNEIVAVKTVNEMMESLRVRLEAAEEKADEYRERIDAAERTAGELRKELHEAYMKLGEQKKQIETLTYDLKNAHELIRSLKTRMDETEERSD